MSLGKGNEHVFKMDLSMLKEPLKHSNRKPQSPVIARGILLPFMILYHSIQRVEHNPGRLGSGGTGCWKLLMKPGGGWHRTLSEPSAPPR